MSKNSAISVAFKAEDAEGGFKKFTLDADGFRQIELFPVT